MARIGFTDKVDRRTLDFPIINKVTAANINEIKASINAIYDALDNMTQVVNIAIDEYDFDGTSYSDERMIGLEVGTTINVWNNSYLEGNGGFLLEEGVIYEYNSETGTITIDTLDEFMVKKFLIQIIITVSYD